MADGIRYKLTWNYRMGNIGGDVVFLPLPKDVPEFEVEAKAMMDEVRAVTGIRDLTPIGEDGW